MTHFDSINIHSVSALAGVWLCIFVLYLFNVTSLLRRSRAKMNKLHDRMAGIEQWLTVFYEHMKEK